MKYFENIMDMVKEKFGDDSFSDLIREARDHIGLKQYRAAEHCGFSLARLRDLETGFFRKMPQEKEIRQFVKLYDLSFEELYIKAKAHVERKKRDRRVRTIKDGSNALPHMQETQKQRF